MIVPNAENAFVDLRKLTDYCLNQEHEIGKHKAGVFASALDLTVDNAEELKNALLFAVKNNDGNQADLIGSDNVIRLILKCVAERKRQLSEAVG